MFTPTHDPAVAAAAAACRQPIEAAVMVVRGPETKGGRHSLGRDLRTLNLLALTPTHLRLFALGGRTGLKVKAEVAAWPRGQVAITATDAERSSFFASTGSSYDYPVHELHVAAPGVELTVDVMAGDPVDAEVLGPEPGLEIQAALARVIAGAAAPPPPPTAAPIVT